MNLYSKNSIFFFCNYYIKIVSAGLPNVSQIPGGVSTNEATSCESATPIVSLKKSHLKDYRCLVGNVILLSSVHLGF